MDILDEFKKLVDKIDNDETCKRHAKGKLFKEKLKKLENAEGDEFNKLSSELDQLSIELLELTETTELTINLPPSLCEEIQSVAQVFNININMFVTSMIYERLEQIKKEYKLHKIYNDSLSDELKSYLKTVDSNRIDLSTVPEYLKDELLKIVRNQQK